MKTRRLKSTAVGIREKTLETVEESKDNESEVELSTKLEKRRRIEDIFEEKRLRMELEEFI